MAVNLETLQIQFEIRDNTGSKLKKLQKQLTEMEGPEIDANTQEAEQKIKELQKTAEELEIEAEIDADTKGAQKKIEALEKEAKSIGGGTVEIGGDRSGFDTVLSSVKGAADDIDAGSADIGGDKSEFDAVTESIKGSAEDIDAGSADIGGDKSNFDDVAASIKGAAEDIDAGSADIGGDKSGFETVTASVKGAADNIDAGSADIGGDKSEFDAAVSSVKETVTSLPDGSVEIYGDPSDAVRDIGTVTDLIDSIPEAPEINPKVDTREAESGIKKIWNMMKAVGIVAAGQKAFEYAMGTVETAYEGQSIENRIKNLGETESQKIHALDRVNAFTGEMNEKFRLNESGLAGMVSDFAAVYKGQGQDLDEALDTAIQTVRYTIDYASALDKTPGEIGEIFMSVLKGQTEVADSAGIYGLTIDKLNQRIDERMGITALEEMEERTEEQTAQLEALKKERDKNIKLLQAEEFAEVIKENASITGLGYEGDFERTMNEYGNQRTILGEQWKTLKEDIGEFLTPAATEATAALNAILTSVTDFTEKLGSSTFAQDVDGYFGSMTVDESTMKEAINHVTQPITEMTEALEAANSALDTANSNMSTSYAKFLKLLRISGADGDLEEDLEEIVDSAEEFADDAVESVEVGRQSMIDRLNVFTGGLLSEETAAMYGIVDSYFDQAMARIEQKRKEFQDALDKWQKENTPQNMQELQNKTYALFEETYQSTAGYMGVDEYDYLKSAYQSGHLSAETLETWMNGMQEAGAEAEAQLQAELEATRRDYLAMGQGVINEETGKPYTVAELDEMFTASTAAYTESKRQEAEGRRFGILSEMLLGEYGSAASGVYDRLYKGEITGDEAMKQITEMVQSLENSGFIEGLLNTSDKTPAMQSMLDLWYGMSQWTGGGYSASYNDGLYKALFGPDYKGSMAGGDAYSYARELYRGTKGYEEEMRQAGLAVLWEALSRTGMTDNPYYNLEAPDGVKNEKINEILNRNWQYFNQNAPEPGSDTLGSLERILNTDLFPTVPPITNYEEILARGMGPLSYEFASGEFATDMSGVAGEFRSALEALPSNINLSLQLGSYEFGAAASEAIATYEKSSS